MKELIIEFIKQNLFSGQSDTPLSADDDLLGSGLVDSMGMMQLITFIEEQFEFKIPFEDMTIENFMTVGDIERYLTERKIEK